MVYFEVKFGWQCFRNKENCNGYPDFCAECLQNQLVQKGFSIEGVTVVEKDSKGRQLDTMMSEIWRKYNDIRNIKSIIILDKNSGSCIHNETISEEIDGILFSGFIQANVMFSGGLSSSQKVDTVPVKEGTSMYAFQYERFNILMQTGDLTRICLVLEVSPSETLKMFLNDFTTQLERQFNSELKKFIQTGKVVGLDTITGLIQKVFETQLLNPIVLNPTLDIEMVKGFDTFEKGVYDIAQEKIQKSGFFLIKDLIEVISDLLAKDPKEILWVIYKFIGLKIFAPRTLEQVSEIADANSLMKNDERVTLEVSNFMTLGNSEVLQIRDEMKNLSEPDARERIDSHIRNATFLMKTFAPEKARQEYEKALIIAKIFNFHQEIGQLSFNILQIIENNRMSELQKYLNQAKDAEKAKDFLAAIKSYSLAKELYLNFFDLATNDKRISKIDDKITKLQKNM